MLEEFDTLVREFDFEVLGTVNTPGQLMINILILVIMVIVAIVLWKSVAKLMG